MREIWNVILLSINICFNRNPKRILYCPLKSQLKYTQCVQGYDRIIQTSRYFSYKHAKKAHLPQRSVDLLQFQNIETKLNTVFKSNWNLQIHLLQAIKIHYNDYIFSEADLLQVFNKKGTRVFSMEEIKKNRWKYKDIPRDTSSTCSILMCSISALYFSRQYCPAF